MSKTAADNQSLTNKDEQTMNYNLVGCFEEPCPYVKSNCNFVGLFRRTDRWATNNCHKYIEFEGRSHH